MEIQLIFLLGLPVISGISPYITGPVLYTHFPSKVSFSNDTGYSITCSAWGKPAPSIEWLTDNGAMVETVSELRMVHTNGTLHFLPFQAHLYSPEIHTRGYRCRAKNNYGQTISAMVRVNAVIRQKYEIRVYDASAIAGNVAVLRCIVPSLASEYVSVTSWSCGSTSVYVDHFGLKYVLGPNRDLYVYNVSREDGYKDYYCKTKNSITGQTHVNPYAAHIFVRDPQEEVVPKLLVDAHVEVSSPLLGEVKLSCVAEGFPIPTYRFFKKEDANLVPLENRYNSRYNLQSAGLLKIESIQLEDAGQYVCVANNSVGEEKVTFSVTVIEQLRLSIQPSTQVINTGKSLELRCIISEGWPIVKIEWYHNGELIVPDKRIKVLENRRKLMILEGNKNDFGMYQCFVSNGLTWKEDTAQLLMGDIGPEMVEWFSEQTLQPGPPLTLKCVAKGTPYPTFTWKLDGFPLPDSSRFIVEQQHLPSLEEVMSQVNISSLKDEDGGVYSCIAKNRVGEVTHSAQISVYGLPYIRPMPKVTAVSGTQLIIKCPVAGYPIESITWEQGGVLLPINRRQRVYPNGTLVIDEVHRVSDSGTYTCQVQNRQKHSSRRDVEVQVLIPPKIMPIIPMTNVLQEGMRAAITCQVIEGDLPIRFEWMKIDDIGQKLELNAITRRIDEYSSSLIIDSLRSHHAGNYTCTARNSAGQQEVTVPLTVNVQPKWISEPKDTSVVLGKDVTLNCQAKGYPVPTIAWRKAIGNNPGEYKDFLYEPNITLFHNGSLHFTHVDKTAEGYYMCEAKNDIGAGVSKVIFLKVNSPAHFARKTKHLNVLKGESAHLQCTALGDNPMELIWKNSKGYVVTSNADSRYSIREQVLDEGMMSELGILKAYRRDTGVYSCHARNSFGQDETHVELTVQEVPEVPKGVHILEQTSRNITVAWSHPYAGNSPIISYVVQTKPTSATWTSQSVVKLVVPGTNTSAIIKNLAPSAGYSVRILAENRIGVSSPTDDLQIITQEEAPTGPPKDVHLKAESSTDVIVTWNPPSKDSWNGNIVGYNIGYREASDNGLPLTANSSTSGYVIKTADVASEYGGQVTITGLKTYTLYEVIVQAYNSRGNGPFSDPVFARTEEGVPSMPPDEITCVPFTSQSIQLSWNPPPKEGQNGRILGYRISYLPAEDWYEEDDYTTKSTESLTVTINGLLKYTNYSFVISAYTQPGDGASSLPVYCQTKEDVPSAPAGIKAALSTLKEIVVSWLPPTKPNGQLTEYTVYKVTKNGSKGENVTHEKIFSEAGMVYKTSRSQEGATYQFWVTASTQIGEGESTAVISVPPSNKVPARILSFTQRIVTPWKKNLTLPCYAVGLPAPKLFWKVNDTSLVSSSEKIEVLKNGSLVLTEVQRIDLGNYSCHVENIHGDDQITYMLYVRVPPDPPELSVVSEDTDSLHLVWRDTEQSNIPVLGYVINYKRDHGDWEEIHIDSRSDNYVLRNLWCGTRYQIYMTAYNKIGTGLPCDIVSTYTKGSVPVPPLAMQQGMTYNTTAACLWLDMWNDGGCNILYFIIEHKKEHDQEWIVSSKPVSPSERLYVITDLQPMTKYQIRMTAHNNIGSTVQMYNFTTLVDNGDNLIPLEFATSSSEVQSDVIFPSVMSIASITALLIVLLVSVLIGVVYYVRRKKRYRRPSVTDDMFKNSTMKMQKKNMKEYGVTGNRSQQTLNAERSCKTDSADYTDEICPYATFQLASKASYGGESTFSDNIYSGPYQQLGSSFVYNHNIPKHPKDHEYTKLKSNRAGSSRDAFLESQESDNLGSTDSEVKRILSLHMPISEYDAQGSDSEMDIKQNKPNTQELASFRHISCREESSSSSEVSPTDGRKPALPARRQRWKGGASLFGKRKSCKSSSGYSSHEEPMFSFSEHINPPLNFSDMQSNRGRLDTAEARKRRFKPIEPRKSAREGSRMQEHSFQIDV